MAMTRTPPSAREKDLEYAKSYGKQLQTLSMKDNGSAPTTATMVRAAGHTPFPATILTARGIRTSF